MRTYYLDTSHSESQENHLPFLKEQVRPSGGIPDAIDRLLGLWTWYDVEVNTLLDTALVCYFMCYSKQCLLYALLAQTSKDNPESKPGQHKAYVRLFNDCLRTMSLEFGDYQAKILAKIKDLKTKHLNDLLAHTPKTKSGLPDMIDIFTNMKPVFHESEEPTEIIEICQGRFMQWIVEDKTSCRFHTLCLTSFPSLQVGCFGFDEQAMAQQVKAVRSQVDSKMDRLKALLKEHIDGHFPTTPAMLDVCQRFINERTSHRLEL
jgi:hypothetical protein